MNESGLEISIEDENLLKLTQDEVEKGTHGEVRLSGKEISTPSLSNIMNFLIKQIIFYL